MYDILIIGSGPAGYVAAIRAAQLGMKVACIEKDSIGGTCLNIGCIPSKTLLDSSLKHYQLINDYAEHGIEAKEVQIDLSKMMSRKEGVVKQLTDGVGALLKSNKVDLIKGSAKILGNSSIEVVNDDGSMTLEAKNIMIATGSYPSELEKIKIGNNIVDNEGPLKFKKVPQTSQFFMKNLVLISSCLLFTQNIHICFFFSFIVDFMTKNSRFLQFFPFSCLFSLR